MAFVLVDVEQSLKGSVGTGQLAVGMVGGECADGRQVHVDGAQARFVLGARVMVLGQDIDGAVVRLMSPWFGAITEDPATGQALGGYLAGLTAPVGLGGGVLATPVSCPPDGIDGLPDPACLAANGMPFDELTASVAAAVAADGVAGPAVAGWGAAAHPADAGRLP